MVRTCNFPGCHSKNIFGAKHFFKFPPDRATRQTWLAAVGLSIYTNVSRTKQLRICSDHFNEDDYAPSQNNKQPRLKRGAVPSHAREHVGPNTSPSTSGSASAPPQVRLITVWVPKV